MRRLIWIFAGRTYRGVPFTLPQSHLNYRQIYSISTGHGLRSAAGNVPDHRCASECISTCREFDPGPVPYFRKDWSWNNLYGHSSTFRWMNHSRRVVVSTSESMCTNYWLTLVQACPGKNVVRWTDRTPIIIAVDSDESNKTKNIN